MATQTEEKQKVVLIAVDGSKHSDYALEYYMDHLHRATDEVIFVFCVSSNTPVRTSLTGNVDMTEHKNHETEHHRMAKYKHIEELAKTHNLKHKFERLDGDPGKQIVKAAHDHKADLIICGSHGHGAFKRAILGSVSEHVLHHSHAPVLICKHKDVRHKHE